MVQKKQYVSQLAQQMEGRRAMGRLDICGHGKITRINLSKALHIQGVYTSTQNFVFSIEPLMFLFYKLEYVDPLYIVRGCKARYIMNIMLEWFSYWLLMKY